MSTDTALPGCEAAFEENPKKNPASGPGKTLPLGRFCSNT
jgi:hypothetical protein